MQTVNTSPTLTILGSSCTMLKSSKLLQPSQSLCAIIDTLAACNPLNYSRRQINDYLKRQRDGSFVLRESRTQDNSFVLCIKKGNHGDNLSRWRVQRSPDGKYSLGNNCENTETFISIKQMLGYYSEQVCNQAWLCGHKCTSPLVFVESFGSRCS